MGKLDFDINILNDGSGIKTTLERNHAKYHDLCYKRYNKGKLCRAKNSKRKCYELHDENKEFPPLKKLRSAVDGIAIPKCVFCSGLDTIRQPLFAAAAKIDHKVHSTEDILYAQGKTNRCSDRE